MAKKRRAKIKRKRTVKKSKAKRPKKPPASDVDALTPVTPDEALERAAKKTGFTGLCG